MYSKNYSFNELFVTFITFIFSFILLFISPLFILINKIRVKKFDEPNNIIITGACGGLGSSLALRYAKPGNNLSLFGLNEESLSNLKNECMNRGANVEINVVDITNQKLLSEKLHDFDSRYSVDLLIANAAAIETQLPNELSFEEKSQKIIQVNVNGTTNTVLPLLESFISRQNGQIVIISSLSCYVDHFYTAYSSSKSFCRSFGLSLRNRLSKYGVGVTIVTPGYLESPMLKSLDIKNVASTSPEKASEYIQRGIEMNLSHIYFPLGYFILAYSMNLISPNLKEAWTFLLTNLLYTKLNINTNTKTNKNK